MVEVKDTETKARWGKGLTELMSQREVSRDEWLRVFPDDGEHFDNWMSGLTAIPPDRQSVLSLWLGKPARELFTDIEPDVLRSR